VLEDNFSDIIGKARRGLGLSAAEVAQLSGSEEDRLQAWESGRAVPDDAALTRLAKTLRLTPDRLIDIARGRWKPPPLTEKVPNFLQITSSYGGMLVNAYLAWDPGTKTAALFDTGADFTAIQKAIRDRSLKVTHLFLTHTHADHVALLEEVRKGWKPEVITSKGEFVPDATIAAEGRSFSIGKIAIQVLETEGHSPGGLTFVLSNLGEGLPEVAVVGDALFAGSVGGPKVSYERLLNNIKRKVLTLPDDTILAPGHGPLTTVGEEKRHNPFLG
jgi:hydroxyacylglutathione hydrolase